MPRRKNDATESWNLKWTSTDYAQLKFFNYKGASNTQIAAILGRTPHAIAQVNSKIATFERGAMPRNSYQYKTIQAGLVLELAVRSGKYPDQRQLWLSKLSQQTGITYNNPMPVVPATPPVVKEEIKVDQKPTDEVKKDSPIKEMLRVSVTVNLNSITSLIKAVKTAWQEEK